jgi:hypothetical protein
MKAFLEQLTAAIEKHQKGQKDPEEEWDEHDYERFMRECDARTDKYRELLEKYGDTDDAEDTINEAMGWNCENEQKFISEDEMQEILEDAEDPPPPELNPAREGIDWIRTEGGEIRHPLQNRCSESALRFWDWVEDVVSLETAPEETRQFVFEFQTTGVKLAGALNSIAEDTGLTDPAFTVAYLKRALGHLHQAQGGLESPATIRLLPKELIAEARRELFEIREGILRLMDEFRGRKSD